MHFTITLALCIAFRSEHYDDKMVGTPETCSKRHASRYNTSCIYFTITIALAEPSDMNIIKDKMCGTQEACSKKTHFMYAFYDTVSGMLSLRTWTFWRIKWLEPQMLVQKRHASRMHFTTSIVICWAFGLEHSGG